MGNHCASVPEENYYNVNVRSWTAHHVFSWISDIGNGELKSVAPIFKKHKINGIQLIAMHLDGSMHRLAELNLTVGDRLLLQKRLDELLVSVSASYIIRPAAETLQREQQREEKQEEEEKEREEEKQVSPPPNPTFHGQSQDIELAADDTINAAPAEPPQHRLLLSNDQLSNRSNRSFTNKLKLFTHNSDQDDAYGSGFVMLDSPSTSHASDAQAAVPLPPLRCHNNTYSRHRPVALDAWSSKHNVQEVLRMTMGNTHSSVSTHHSHHSQNMNGAWYSDDSGAGAAAGNGGDSSDLLHVDDRKVIVGAVPVGPVPMLLAPDRKRPQQLQHAHIAQPLRTRAIDDDDGDDDDDDADDNWNTCIDHAYEACTDDDDGGMYEMQMQAKASYPPAIAALTMKHTATLFMLETTQQRLLNGYLRLHVADVVVTRGIRKVIASYVDESSIHYFVNVPKICEKTSATQTKQLRGKTFAFDLNMEHEMELTPTLQIRQRQDVNQLFYDIELSLECEHLPAQIDRCDVLINICCICHELRYQKIDTYAFGIDYYKPGGYANLNMLNKKGLQMMIADADLSRVEYLRFKMTATVLHIEYDPTYENFSFTPMYNRCLRLQSRIAYAWSLSRHVVSIMAGDTFKQKFYSPHFHNEYWCLSCYKHHEHGQIVVCLHLLRLPAMLKSITCQTEVRLQRCVQGNILPLRNVCRLRGEQRMDIEYNNCVKLKVSVADSQALLSQLQAMSEEEYVSVQVQIHVTKRNNYNQVMEPQQLLQADKGTHILNTYFDDETDE